MIMLKNKTKQNKQQKNVHSQPDTSDITQRPRLMKAAEERLTSFGDEMAEALSILEAKDKTVTVFGSARFKTNHPDYKKAREISAMLANEGFTIVTGGGGGIMQAGNHGAHDVDKSTVGFNIRLPYEQILNKYVSEPASFNYFFTRKVMLTFFADAYIYFPGGFGTLDELFEVLTLMQTKKIPIVPVVLVGGKFWRPLDRFIKNHLLKASTISKEDLKLYTITDDGRKIKNMLKECGPNSC